MTSAQKKHSVWLENFRLALQTLLAHKFRSILTVLGVFIGIITVVLVATILTGMRNQIVGMIEEYGTNNVYAYHLEQSGRNDWRELERKPLQPEYAPTILTRCDAVLDLTYSLTPRFLPSQTVKYHGLEYKNGSINGTLPNYLEVTNGSIGDGRQFTEIDNEHRLQNCIIGTNVAEALFPTMSPLGKEILLAGKPFMVIGVLAKRKSNFLGQNEEDSEIMIPYLTLKKLSPRDDWVWFIIRSKPGQVSRSMDQAEQVLRSLRKLKAKDDNDFSITTADSIIQEFNQVTSKILLITIAISAVGLLVGGIGVMNIMLVSVRERTREIGVRKALGARRRDITIQFLIEAMALTGAGGLVGIIAAGLIGFLISLFKPTFPAIPPLWAVGLAFAVSILVGLGFGVWPANRAAHLDPIEALRYE